MFSIVGEHGVNPSSWKIGHCLHAKDDEILKQLIKRKGHSVFCDSSVGEKISNNVHFAEIQLLCVYCTFSSESSSTLVIFKVPG